MLHTISLNISSCFDHNRSENNVKNEITTPDAIILKSHLSLQNVILLSINCEAASLDKHDIRSNDNILSIHSFIDVLKCKLICSKTKKLEIIFSTYIIFFLYYGYDLHQVLILYVFIIYR